MFVIKSYTYIENFEKLIYPYFIIYLKICNDDVHERCYL